MFLNDSQLIQLLQPPDPIINGVDLGKIPDPYAADSPVQPCSVDLRIGDIFVPGVDENRAGGAENPREILELEPGKTAVIKTLETCDFPSDVGGFGFPPNAVSSKGILMTNPGHVDPGYQGTMEFTVINMGRDKYPLARGRKIVSLLLFKLDPPVHKNLYERGVEKQDGVAALLAALSRDFLNITSRVREAAKREEEITRREGLRVPIIVGILTVLIVAFPAWLSLRGEVSDLKAHTDGTAGIQKLDERLKALERNQGELVRSHLALRK